MIPVSQELEASACAIADIVLEGAAIGRRSFKIEADKAGFPLSESNAVDIHVEELHPGKPALVYLFECKSRTKAVTKNDISAFAEKIALLQAKRGYFVAAAFTPAARAQAAREPRLTLLPFAAHPISPLPLQMCSLTLKAVTWREALSAEGPLQVNPHLPVLLDGKKTALGSVVIYFARQALQRAANQRDFSRLDAGDHDFDCTAVVTPPKGLVAAGIEITHLDLALTFTFSRHAGALWLGYDTEKRAIGVRFESLAAKGTMFEGALSRPGPESLN